MEEMDLARLMVQPQGQSDSDIVKYWQPCLLFPCVYELDKVSLNSKYTTNYMSFSHHISLWPTHLLPLLPVRAYLHDLCELHKYLPTPFRDMYVSDATCLFFNK